MNVALTILYSEGWQDLLDVVLPNAQEYCDRHGYQLITTRYPSWGSDFGFKKLELIRHLFSTGVADVVLSMDADTLITNHSVRIEDLIEHNRHPFYICQDYNGINAGVFIVIDCEWSRGYLENLLACRGRGGIDCEQNAIESLAYTSTDHLVVVPHPAFNSYLYQLYPEVPPQLHEEGQWQSGDFVLHLPGLPMEQRLKILQETKITK